MDPLARRDDEPDIIPAKKLLGKVSGLFVAAGDGFETAAVESLDLTFDGIPGDFHCGATRRSGGREPWYPRGTEIRNERQVSIVSPEELRRIARAMELGEIKAEWIGANIVLDGIADLSMLPSGTLLFFRNGVTIKVDAQNGPCRVAGKLVAERARMADPEAGALLFPKAAKRLRGLVAWVEKPGRLALGEDVSVRLPEQWIYRT